MSSEAVVTLEDGRLVVHVRRVPALPDELLERVAAAERRRRTRLEELLTPEAITRLERDLLEADRELIAGAAQFDLNRDGSLAPYRHGDWR